MPYQYIDTAPGSTGSPPSLERGLAARLTNNEKRELSMAAKQAWIIMTRNGATDETEQDFRHRISIQACGVRVSEALRKDYAGIAAAFAIMGGKVEKAYAIAVRGETEGRRIALRKLTELLASQGKQLSYAAPVIKNYGGGTIDTAPTKILWAVFCAFNGGSKKRTARRKNWKARTAAAAAH